MTAHPRAVPCPFCGVPAEKPCVITRGDLLGTPMTFSHNARTRAADHASDSSAAQVIDTIPPLEDLPDPVPEKAVNAVYENGTVIRWSNTYDNGIDYIFAAIYIGNIGWFITGKYTDPLTWNELYEKHLKHAKEVVLAGSWTAIPIHQPLF